MSDSDSSRDFNPSENVSDVSESLSYSSDQELEMSEDEISIVEKIPNVSLYLIQTKDKLIGVFLTPDKKNVVGYIDNQNKQISTNETQLSKFNTTKIHDIIIDDAYDFTKPKTCNDKEIQEKILETDKDLIEIRAMFPNGPEGGAAEPKPKTEVAKPSKPSKPAPNFDDMDDNIPF